MKFPLLILVVLLGSLVFGSGVKAADLVFEDDTIVEIGGHDYLILAGSEADSVDVGDTTVTVTVPSGSTFTFQSSGRHALSNNDGIAQTCTDEDNRLIITGLQSDVVITPNPDTLCTTPPPPPPPPPPSSGGGGVAPPPATMGMIGDCTGDGRVWIADASILISDWGTSNPRCDLNGDGIINIIDVSIMISNWTG